MNWKTDIPTLDPDTRRLSDQAVHQQWVRQLEQEASERERWKRALGGDYTVRGPYYRRRKPRRGFLVALALAVLLATLWGLSGCSLSSDSEVEELIAQDLLEAQDAQRR